MARTNWAGNVPFSPEQFHRPTSMTELQQIVAASTTMRVLGTGHSFNALADTAGDQVSIAGLPAAVELDSARAQARVTAGSTYAEVTGRLHAGGWALPNLGSLPHISVAGACATGTHGSGDGLGNLATSVAALEMVTADGDVVSIDRDDNQFAGAVVALGALGVVTSLTLDLVPTFEVAQWVFEDLPFDRLVAGVDEVFASAYSVSVFTGWRGAAATQVWRKQRVDPPDSTSGSTTVPDPRWLGARLADGPRHPIATMPPIHCTEQGGRPGPWHDRLPHFRADFTPSSGEELQSEFLVARASAAQAIAALRELGDLLAPVLQVSEIRTVAADGLWLSPSHGRDSVALHFTWVRDASAVAPRLAAVEAALAPFDARPHWGKVFTVPPETLRGRYEHADDFRALRGQYDKQGKFSNAFIDRCLGKVG